jgi:hypothetical protein
VPEILPCISIALYAIASVARLTHRITTRRFYALWALGCALNGINHIVWPDPPHAVVDAVATALFSWLWWKSGGGDGPRRRLRAWTHRFRGVRRTAPVAV